MTRKLRILAILFVALTTSTYHSLMSAQVVDAHKAKQAAARNHGLPEAGIDSIYRR